MTFAAERYYNLYKISLMMIGLWPYRKSIISQIQTIFYFAFYFSIIFFQLTRCMTITYYNPMLIIKFLSYFLPTIVYIINYNSFYFNAKAIKQTLKHIRMDWKTITDSREIEILTKYTYVAFVSSLTMYICLSLSIGGFMLLECSPIILDIILPMNVSRPRSVGLFFELFIDEEQYFLLYVTYEVLTIVIGFGTMVATGTFLLAVGMHTCAEFKIASDLIHNLVTDRTLKIPISERTHFMHQNICRAVHIHRRAMSCINDLLNKFQIWYFVLIIIGVTSLSCNLFQFLHAIMQLNDLYDLFICFSMFVGHIVYMFAGNLSGQAVIDHSKEITNATYHTLWYVAPLPIQKLLLFIQKSVKDQRLLVGGLFVASLEGFSTLITSAMSYFTMMYTVTGTSTRQDAQRDAFKRVKSIISVAEENT